MLPSLLFGEPSRAFWAASRAEPSFNISKNEPNTSLLFYNEYVSFIAENLVLPRFGFFDQFFDKKQPSMAIAEKKNGLFIQFQWQISTCSDWPNHILKGTYGFVLMSRIYRLVLPIFFDTSFLKNRTSRAFWSKARAKTEPSLGSGATLVKTVKRLILFEIYRGTKESGIISHQNPAL